MKNIFLYFVIFFVSILATGCQRGPSLSDEFVVDSNIPKVDSIRSISDIDQIALEWTPIYSEEIDGYYIYRSNPQRSDDKLERIAVLDDRYISHFIDKNLLPETKYYYRMSSFSMNKKESVLSPVHEAFTLSKIESVPYFEAIVGLPERAKLIWRPHPDVRVAGYVVERMKLNSNEWEKMATLQGRFNAEYIDKKLSHDSLYRYRIFAFTYSGIYSDSSVVVEARTKPLPPMVKGVKATYNLPKKILITWDSSDYEDHSYYNVYRSSGSNIFHTYLAKTKSPFFEDNIEKDGVTYNYYVTSVDKDGLESSRQKTSFKGGTLDIPRAPSIVSAKYLNNYILLEWEDISKRADKYEIVRSSNGEEKIFTNINTTQIVDKDIYTDRKYKYVIYTIDSFGLKSNPSSYVVVSTSSK